MKQTYIALYPDSPKLSWRLQHHFCHFQHKTKNQNSSPVSSQPSAILLCPPLKQCPAKDQKQLPSSNALLSKIRPCNPSLYIPPSLTHSVLPSLLPQLLITRSPEKPPHRLPAQASILHLFPYPSPLFHCHLLLNNSWMQHHFLPSSVPSFSCTSHPTI